MMSDVVSDEGRNEVVAVIITLEDKIRKTLIYHSETPTLSVSLGSHSNSPLI